MHLSQDDIFQQCDALDDSLAAARATLEAMAAQTLSFRAQLRVQHESTRRAKRLLLTLAGDGAVHLADETDEILRRTLGSPLDDGPEGAQDELAGLSALVDDTDTGIDGLVDFGDALDDENIDVDSLVHFDGASDESEPQLIVFDDDHDDVTTITLDPTGEAGRNVLDDLSENLGDEPSSPGDPDSFVTYDTGDELIHIGPDPDGDAPIDLGLDNTDQGDIYTVDARDEPSGGDATLVADLESLVRLKDMIAEDSAAAHGAAEEADTGHVVDAGRVSATTLSDDDLGKLGFDSAEALVSPEGADADPNSETSPRPEVRMPTPEPAPKASKKKRGRGRGKSKDDAKGSALDAGIPTIREQQAAGATARPSAAAIQLSPGGGSSVVIEQEPLALGEAEDPDSGSSSGFALQVEEYEVVEVEQNTGDELADEPAPEPVATPAPTLSDAEESALIKQAASCHERGELPVAADLYSDLLDFNPDNADAALGRGRVYLDLGDYARAMSDFTIAEDIKPDDPDVNAAIGELYYARKDYLRAIEYFDNALENDPKHAMAWCRRGIAHYYRKEYDKAYDDLVQAQKLDDAIPNIRTYIGMVKKKRK